MMFEAEIFGTRRTTFAGHQLVVTPLDTCDCCGCALDSSSCGLVDDQTDENASRHDEDDLDGDGDGDEDGDEDDDEVDDEVACEFDDEEDEKSPVFEITLGDRSVVVDINTVPLALEIWNAGLKVATALYDIDEGEVSLVMNLSHVTALLTIVARHKEPSWSFYRDLDLEMIGDCPTCSEPQMRMTFYDRIQDEIVRCLQEFNRTRLAGELTCRMDRAITLTEPR